MELGKAINYEIHIMPSANKGFVVHIGCGMFVAADKASLKDQLGEYLDNPQKFEKAYNEIQPPAPEGIEEVPQREDAPPPGRPLG